jgi:hypothetical protein
LDRREPLPAVGGLQQAVPFTTQERDQGLPVGREVIDDQNGCHVIPSKQREALPGRSPPKMGENGFLGEG